MRPGFELGLAMQEIVQLKPATRAIMMGQHGFISWHEDDKRCYEETLRFIERASTYIADKYAAKGGDAAAFGGAKYQTLAKEKRRALLAQVLPWIRGRVSQQKRQIGTVQDDENILRFINSHDAPRLAELGTSCPDHFLRTKIKPLYGGAGVSFGQRPLAMLELRPNCECCDRDLPPDSPLAMICTFECTFCAPCVETFRDGECPNCGGPFVRRPVRPARLLAKYPPFTERVLNPAGCRS